MDLAGKGINLIRFLKETATLRRPRLATYRSEDQVLWFSEIRREISEIRSPILNPPADDVPDYWLEVRKTAPPARPPIPSKLKDWVREEDLDNPHHDPELKKEITLRVEREIPDPDAPPEAPRTIKETVEEIRRLKDHPEIDDAWMEYYFNQWEPWAERRRRWEKISKIYEQVDFMRRRLEEAEERFELFLGVGLLQWRDSTNTTIKRHLLVGPAEIIFDPSRGLITVVPAAFFSSFKIELDMLELADRPWLEDSTIQGKLAELDIQAWDKKKIGEILREIANRARADSQVDEEALEPAPTANDTFWVRYSPALILRERRPTAFEEVVNRLIKTFETASPNITEPWRQFLAEGQGLPKDEQVQNPHEGRISFDKIYFPLPTNEEQRQIIARLQSSPAVVVKGPPGTGKSHTIANLICHLLATGEKILITAHAPKALTVLRDMLPPELSDLCLISLGGSREDQRQLESCVRKIIERKNRWDQAERLRIEQKIADLEEALLNLKENLSEVERKLREFREAETHIHELPGGYKGSAAQVARRLMEEQERFSWVPDIPPDSPSFPFTPNELKLMAEMHGMLSPEMRNELQRQIGDFEIPPPEEFQRLLSNLRSAEERESRAKQKVDLKKFNLLQCSQQESLERTAKAIHKLDEHALQSEVVLKGLTENLFSDFLKGKIRRWKLLYAKALKITSDLEALLEDLGNPEISIPADYKPSQVRADAERRLAYIEQGGWQGFWVIRPKVLKETSYLEIICRENGLSPTDPTCLKKIISSLKAKELAAELKRLWPEIVGDINQENLQLFILDINDKVSAFGRLLNVLEELGEESIGCIPLNERSNLAFPKERRLWLDAIEAKISELALQEVQRPLHDCRQKLDNLHSQHNAHESIGKLLVALDRRDPESWKEAFEQREVLRTRIKHYRQYRELMARLKQSFPALAELLHQHQGYPEWHSRILSLESAWCWANARGWLKEITDHQRYKELVERYHDFKEKIEKHIKEIAVERAWQAFFNQLDDHTIQNLHAWQNAMNKIGKGTGKYAYIHRRYARNYLMKCIPKIPAWIMPLHKLWETIDAEPGIFNTIIIDEASQADITSLVLFLLGKRIIVVGDKMQNSPEDVGIKEGDIQLLIEAHLKDFHFRGEFRPDSSLFDHAERGFGNLISLREHFRCVPEIIRFSNDLCYREAPLVPLRQVPVDRLPPLRNTFVSGGYCEGEGQRIRNEVEAEKLVQTLIQCLKDSAYEGKSFGVIVLQGRAQADLIERKLNTELNPDIIVERKLRCGVPASFQGDQRDVIFLSMVIAPNVNFRAVSELDFVRRYNVAMSRARDQVWLFHSVNQADLSPDCLRLKLLRFFETPWTPSWEGEELQRLEREAARTPRQPGEQPDPYESWFEVDVALELLRKGYRVLPQYEVAGYRIDLVVEGGESRLAVECDGDAWHGPERYAADMARQRQLERVGWTFVRIRESEFYFDRERALQKIIQACNELNIFPAIMGSCPSEVTERGQAEPDLRPEAEPGEESSEPEETSEQTDIQSGPFSGYSMELAFPDPREASISNISAALKKIIEKDGPLTKSSIYRLYLEGCPHIRRCGPAVRERLNLALRNLLMTKEIVQEDELGSGKPEGIVIRLAGTPKVRLRPAGRRRLEEIPPSEIFLVLDRLQNQPMGNGIDEELVFRKVLEHFGLRHLTQSRKKHLKNISKFFYNR